VIDAPLKIGHLCLFTVCKAWPEASAALTWIEPRGPFAILPYSEADRPYRVGDTGFAAVAAATVPYPRLSQRTVHYVRRIAELVCSPLRAEGRVAIARVAYRTGWPFAKVLVRAASPEAFKAAVGLLPQARAHWSPSLMLVPKEDELASQVRAALYPAPAEAIRAVRAHERPRTLWLDVEPLARGRVIGPRGANLFAAELLLRRRLVLAGTEPATGITSHRDAERAPAWDPLRVRPTHTGAW
jgi:hypothetical protein